MTNAEYLQFLIELDAERFWDENGDAQWTPHAVCASKYRSGRYRLSYGANDMELEILGPYDLQNTHIPKDIRDGIKHFFPTMRGSYLLSDGQILIVTPGFNATIRIPPFLMS